MPLVWPRRGFGRLIQGYWNRHINTEPRHPTDKTQTHTCHLPFCKGLGSRIRGITERTSIAIRLTFRSCTLQHQIRELDTSKLVLSTCKALAKDWLGMALAKDWLGMGRVWARTKHAYTRDNPWPLFYPFPRLLFDHSHVSNFGSMSHPNLSPSIQPVTCVCARA